MTTSGKLHPRSAQPDKHLGAQRVQSRARNLEPPFRSISIILSTKLRSTSGSITTWNITTHCAGKQRNGLGFSVAYREGIRRVSTSPLENTGFASGYSLSAPVS